ncbi:MAG: hypothetical protein IMW99_08820, partial [Firmicutes bacterium]|nr:hypothetical protein [Bacillota bacterium]
MVPRFRKGAGKASVRTTLFHYFRPCVVSFFLVGAVVIASMAAGAVSARAAGPGEPGPADGQSVPMIQADSLSVAVIDGTGLSVGLWMQMPRAGNAFRLAASVDVARDASDAPWQSCSLSAVWQARQSLLLWRLYGGIGGHYDIAAKKAAPHVLVGLQALTLFVEAQQGVASSIPRDAKPVYRLG